MNKLNLLHFLQNEDNKTETCLVFWFWIDSENNQANYLNEKNFMCTYSPFDALQIVKYRF